MWDQNGLETMRHTSFSGTISPSPEVLKWFQDSMDKFERDKEKALRLFFLMRFGIPLRCAEGDKKICRYEYGFYSEYSFNGIVFAIEDYSQEYYMRSTMSLDDQSEWLRNIPMKEFKIFGLYYRKV